MKLQYRVGAAIALVSVGFCGCTTTTTTTTTTETTDQTQKRVYTQEDLRKTGQSETGPALEKVDASVTTTSRRP